MPTQTHFTNKDITHLLNSVAASLELTGANRFRYVAYRNAADTIEHMTQQVYDIWQNGELSKIEGIGSSIAEHLNEYFQKPEGSYLDAQLDKVPRTVFELMKAPGIGPKKAYKVAMEFDLHNVDTVYNDVKELAAQGLIAQMPGFGAKSEKDMIEAIENYEKNMGDEERMPLPEAWNLAQQIIAYMKQLSSVEKIDVLGSLRRMAPTIGDVDLAIVADEADANEIIEHFVKFPLAMSIEGKGNLKASIITSAGKRIDLRVTDADSYGAMLQYFTGNKIHNVKLREYALKQGMSLSEHGVKDTKSGEITRISSEEDFYKHIGLPWIPPEIRHGTSEVQRAIKGDLPELINVEDIRGEFHMHSSFNIETSHDLGEHTIQEMAEKGLSLGYEYIALSEHNPSQKGHSPEDITELLKKKEEAIHQVMEKMKNTIHIFNSLEIDILPDGTLPVPDEAFDHLDLCVISIHSSFKQNRKDMTARILRAMDYPKVKIIGHPTGRLLSRRQEIDVEWDLVFEKARSLNIAMEINSYPDRLDLPDAMVQRAIEQGNKLVIDTDAHSIKQMDNMRFGISVARRGWATKDDIMNTRKLEDIHKWLKTTSK